MTTDHTEILHNSINETEEWWNYEWWNYEWWKSNDMYKDLQIDLEIMESIIHHVSKLYNKTWFKKYYKEWETARLNTRNRHIFIFYLITTGLMPLAYIIELGKNLIILNQHQHFAGNLFKRLRNPREFNGANLELKILTHFLQGNFKITRNPKSTNGNKNADFQIICEKYNEKIFFELKSINTSKVNLEKENFNRMLFSAIAPGCSCNYEFNFSNEFIRESLTKDGHKKIMDTQNDIFKTIREHTSNNAEQKNWGEHIIPGIAKYILYASKERNTNYTNGIPFGNQFELERIANNIIKDAKDQLTLPGVLIIESRNNYPQNFCQNLAHYLSCEGSNYPTISLICLIHTRLSITSYVNFINKLDIFPNPHARNISRTNIMNFFYKLVHT